MTITKVRTLNFDPGLTRTGWSVTDYDLETGVLQVVRVGDITPTAVASKAAKRPEADKYGKRVVSLAVLRSAIKSLIDEFHPVYLTMEGVFFNPSRPEAHAALCMWQCTARMTAFDHAQLPITAIPPKAVKLAISGDGTSGKLNVQQAIASNPKIVFKNDIMLASLSEHCADSIAIGYAFVKNCLPGIILSQQPEAVVATK